MSDATRTFTFEQLEACLCVWEDIIFRLDAAADSLQKIADLTAAQEKFGYASLRLTATPAIADRALEVYYLIGDDTDVICFDWEFIPSIVAATNWSSFADYGGDPNVWLPEAQPLADRLRVKYRTDNWRSHANSLLKAKFGISLEEAGVTEEQFDFETEPQAWVDAYAEKYDLDRIESRSSRVHASRTQPRRMSHRG